MPRALLTEEEFSRIIVSRARRERPDIRVKAMGRFLLTVEAEPGRRRVVSLMDLYQSYCENPADREAVISSFLTTLVYEEPAAIKGSFAENRLKVMPQVVPPSLLDFCRRDKRELAAVGYVGGLSIAFVIDEAERYAYIHRRVMEAWQVTETDLLRAALENLQGLTRAVDPPHNIGLGDRLTIVWESFDGYDATRILQSRDLNEAAARVRGNPVIAIPHRDYMVMFGDADPTFMLAMAERVREDFEAHNYRITPKFFTLEEGSLTPYEGPGKRQRLLN